MANLTISEAAQAVKVSRQTLYNSYIKPGKISVNRSDPRRPVIDTAELLRVFGELKKNPAAAPADPPQAADQSALIAELRERIRLLEAQLAKSEARYDRCWTELQAAQARLLPPPPAGGFWSRLFGGGS